MKMRQNVKITDPLLWDVIINGNAEEEEEHEVEEGQPKMPKSTIKASVRRLEDKALNILLSAIPENQILKFGKATDAKSLWHTIKAMFGGNEASKKMNINRLNMNLHLSKHLSMKLLMLLMIDLQIY